MEETCLAFLQNYVPEARLQTSFFEAIKSGVVLCKLVNAITPGAIQKIDERKNPFVYGANHQQFLNYLASINIPKCVHYTTQNLVQGNENAVSNCISCIVAFANQHKIELDSKPVEKKKLEGEGVFGDFEEIKREQEELKRRQAELLEQQHVQDEKEAELNAKEREKQQVLFEKMQQELEQQKQELARKEEQLRRQEREQTEREEALRLEHERARRAKEEAERIKQEELEKLEIEKQRELEKIQVEKQRAEEEIQRQKEEALKAEAAAREAAREAERLIKEEVERKKTAEESTAREAAERLRAQEDALRQKEREAELAIQEKERQVQEMADQVRSAREEAKKQQIAAEERQAQQHEQAEVRTEEPEQAKCSDEQAKNERSEEQEDREESEQESAGQALHVKESLKTNSTRSDEPFDEKLRSIPFQDVPLRQFGEDCADKIFFEPPSRFLKTYKCNVAVLGAEQVGKVSVCQRLQTGEFSQEFKRQEFYFRKFAHFVNDQPANVELTLKITDDAKYIRQCQFVFVIFAHNNVKSFKGVQKYVKIAEKAGVDDIIVIGNKADEKQGGVSVEDVQKFTEKLKKHSPRIKYVSTSCVKGFGIKQLVESLDLRTSSQ